LATFPATRVFIDGKTRPPDHFVWPLLAEVTAGRCQHGSAFRAGKRYFRSLRLPAGSAAKKDPMGPAERSRDRLYSRSRTPERFRLLPFAIEEVCLQVDKVLFQYQTP